MNAIDELRRQNPSMTVMEVCGSHTAAIAQSGLRALLPDGIRLVSGPGCPVCVTDAALIDGVIDYAQTAGACVLTFGDLFRVRGSRLSFAEARADGGDYRVLYSPTDAVALALQYPERRFVFAAVGFETTAPLYALAMETMIARGVHNLKFAFALKTMIPAMAYICETAPPDGFICPGHVSAIIGARAYAPLAAYGKPLIIAGFEPEMIAAAILRIHRQKDAGVVNLYKSVVSDNGNEAALALLDKYFTACDAVWRGIGVIKQSGLALKDEYAAYEIPVAQGKAAFPAGCRCSDVLLGRISPNECPLFNTACTPDEPIGACMVSNEGACGVWAREGLA